MIILSAEPSFIDEYEPEIFITTTIKGHHFAVPYTLYFDGLKLHIYHFKELKYTIDKKIDIKYDKYIFRILIGNEIGIAENYVKLPPDIFICFDKTSYPSKYFYRKAQMWIGAQISKTNVFGQVIYTNAVNRVLFSPKAEINEGIIFEGTTHVVIDDSYFTKQESKNKHTIWHVKKSKGENNNDNEKEK
ncbi:MULTISPECIES: hypothetical protein [Fervidobacterium]|uniref:Uncharacterized protein n=1 Tax=Fervidobacterium nodosum (strain ATCC 35602 / DSM 5306 / Rt17-B1) TaxID=381764 RepID=A7HLT4_FERNB|nr:MULTISPECIES: hypothetical protein [Fervidobacterium]ABS60867.1 hypothetical protein Fnod_1017 [Fervidobacterium nodosum Rt17-B1]KAF2962060.1 hypothetical protein AS161_06400 [Fervidobacterium sp. 2310opik-2]PHJ13568.1 hypothetical protein IM41_05560 [Fervidobacterium sp. SC_NGM5_G05]HOJ95143.1 hypothetical protein [Fervidobacterium nodosum]